MLLLDDINRRRDRNYCDQILLIKKIRKITRHVPLGGEKKKINCVVGGYLSV